MTKETAPSQRALDHAAKLAGWTDWHQVNNYISSTAVAKSIQAHAVTLDQLWDRCPDLAPKTKGELFADEMLRRRSTFSDTFREIAAQMIDENWEPSQ